MRRKLSTRIIASVSCATLFAGAFFTPAEGLLSRVVTENSLTASAWETTKNLDSTGTFYISLDNSDIRNGVSKATEAQIKGVVSSKIPKYTAMDIPSEVTVEGKNYNGYKFKVTVPVTSIGASAFKDQKSLIAVNIPSTVKTIDFDAFKGSGLVTLDLPSTITGVASGAFADCDNLYNVNFKCKQPPITAFQGCDDLKTFNYTRILSHNPKTGEPVLNSIVLNELYKADCSYSDFAECPCVKSYLDDYISYIVRTNTSTTDPDIVKARKLHDWLLRNTEYDHEATGVQDITQDPWSPFFHKNKAGKLTAVCNGYAGAYKMLLDAANVECYHVTGNSSIGKDSGHAWNIVKIAGNYYHVDCTWDDSEKTEDKYRYFMRSDDFFNSNHDYDWKFEMNGVEYNRNTGAAPYDLTKLGDVNQDNKVTLGDAAAIQNYKLNYYDLYDYQKMRADVNLDGTIDMADIVTLRSAVSRMDAAGYTGSLFSFLYLF